MPLRTDYPLYPDAMIEGALIDAGPHNIITLSNTGGAVKQITTVYAPTAVDSTVYSIIVDGAAATFTSGTGTNAAAIQAGLINAIRQSPLVYAKVIPTTGASNAVVLTARRAGTAGAFSVATTGPGFSISNTTAPVDSVLIPFGRFVVTSIGSGDPPNGCRLIDRDLNPVEMLRGVAVRTNTLESQGTGFSVIEGYRYRDPVNVLLQGRVAMRTTEPVTPQTRCHVVTSGANAGMVAGSGTTLSIGCTFASSAPAGGLVVVELNLPVAGRAQ